MSIPQLSVIYYLLIIVKDDTMDHKILEEDHIDLGNSNREKLRN